MKIEDVAFEIRCADARKYARKLRRNGGHPSGINFIIKGIWGEEVEDHIKSCQDTDYYLPDEKENGH